MCTNVFTTITTVVVITLHSYFQPGNNNSHNNGGGGGAGGRNVSIVPACPFENGLREPFTTIQYYYYY